MRKERCASTALATVYIILHRLIMSVESSKNKKMYKMKNKEQKKRMKTQLLYT